MLKHAVMLFIDRQNGLSQSGRQHYNMVSAELMNLINISQGERSVTFYSNFLKLGRC